jgi:hypothetical protein
MRCTWRRKIACVSGEVIRVLKKLGLAALLALLASCAPQQTKPSYISIKSASVNVREVAIITHVHLQELPAMLPFNAPDLPDNRMEYEWMVSFDVDGDNTSANNIEVALAKFKFSGSEAGIGRVTEFAQHSVVRVDESGRGKQVITGSKVHQEGNTLVLSVSKNEHPDLLEITRATPWRVQTYAGRGQENIIDYFPANGGYFTP